MPSPRVLQAQLQDLLDACRNDSRLTATVDALEGALGTLSEGENAPPPSPGARAARGEEEAAQPLRSIDQRERSSNEPSSWHEAKSAATNAMAEGNAA